MLPQTQRRKSRNSSKVNLIISVVFHGVIVFVLVYFAARGGVLGKQIQKLAVHMEKEKPPEKKPDPVKPKVEPPKVEPEKLAVAPKMTAAPPPAATTAAEAPPTTAPPAVDVPSFAFDGGREVVTGDPITLYKGQIEARLKAKWDRPEDLTDKGYEAEVDISVDPNGQLSNPKWLKGSGNQKWDDSVKAAVSGTTSLPLAPPKNFPSHVMVRFDVTEETQQIMP